MNEMNEAFETLSKVSEENRLNQGQIMVYLRMLRHWHKLGYPDKFNMEGKLLANTDWRGDIANARGYVRELEAKGLIKRKNIAYNNIGNTDYIIVRTKLPVTKKQKEEHREVMEYLNERLGRRFSLKTKSYKSKIYARITEGYTVDDLKHVVDKKAKEWVGTEFEKYLNPDTLFSASHFDVYLNQADSSPRQISKGGRYI